MPDRRKSFFHSALFTFLLSLVGGGGSYWIIHEWLSPKPTISFLPKVQLITYTLSDSMVLFDAQARWMCIRRPNADRLATKFICDVYDLFSQGKAVWTFEWDYANEVDQTPIVDGYRSVRATNAGTLEVLDRNFATQEQRVISVLHGVRAKNFMSLKLVNTGKQLLVQHRWPLWPWRLLAAQGQLPLDALFLCSHTTLETYTTGDGILFSVWDVEKARKVSEVLVSPPISRNLAFTEDGKRIVIPEALKQAESCFWVKWYDPAKNIGVPKPVVQYLPALPRGVRVVDLGSEKITVLSHTLPEEYQGTNSAALTLSLAGNQLMVGYFSAVPDYFSSVPVNVMLKQQFSDILFPRYDLITGAKTSRGMPNCTVMAHPGWGAQISQSHVPWPAWIQYISEQLGYNLNVFHPRSRCLMISFIDVDRQENRYHYQLSSPEGEKIQKAYSADKQAIVIWRQFAEGLQVIRWQVPFEVYSPWWSLGTGLFFFTLPLAWWVWRYTTTHALPVESPIR
ncbi:MAG: hypothetical protein QM703_11925 [Gemmatales bacterium]